ncbi:putative epidermal retinal dehydrogenase 2 protein [Phaeoacremonium minimum UCRPA7]|uniref:Putative epidermal retinal dehydrogenase 2 protein n=1 Tax=Phaeoacremonium minimum (strain UCR-PA7) TaxID=1286976 RepID=R8BBV6_PHAM7|nr:putative epidermal retinal dehydrogenase 2 protein [Phaeoacremonium minimum UCRPA7]EON96772.1 putative epidermal retinal dehydrogenase 2 protein [Phaeoacremonium minimum UCRPA7]
MAQQLLLTGEQGIKVVVLDIQPLSFEAPPEVHYFECDITSPAEIAAVAKEVRLKVGHPSILINNAGVARGKNLLVASERNIRFTFDVNTFAQFWTVREFLPDMIAHNHGMVVTVASFAAWVTVPDMVDYAASKAAAYAFHEGLTAELKTRYNAPKVRLRSKGANIMPNFRGRQVVTDLDKFYADREKSDTEESTVLVPEAK